MKGNHNNLRKGRFSQKGTFYHVSFRIHEHRKELNFKQRVLIARNIESKEMKLYWSIYTWVIMPNHVHLLFKLIGEKTLSQTIGRLKSKTALEVNRHKHEKQPLWQTSYYDHAIRNEESLIAVARYIVANPLRAEIVNTVALYPFWNSVWLDCN